jgi:hypothetical protein
MATRNSRRRSKNVIDLESSGDELELTSSSDAKNLKCKTNSPALDFASGPELSERFF